MSLLSVYASPLDTRRAAHLLRRATFGASPERIREFTGLTAEAAAQRLLADQPAPPPPLDPTTRQTFVNLAFSNTEQGRWQNYVKGWWMARMQQADSAAIEKMTAFWQNHFVVSFSVVNDARFVYRYLALLRQHALGNFRTLLIEVTKDPAMLRYLNGNSNTAGRVNENYARELQELFSIGRGNYTEADVRAAARVLTGWRDLYYRNEQRADIAVEFRPAQHDTTNKTFSASYQNTVIRGRTGPNAGNEELADLIDMILRQPEAARFICRKLYRWFVNHDITPAIEMGFIEPLAQVFRQSGYEIKPVLAALFASTHFYDESVRGAVIKSPFDLTLGTLQFFGVSMPDMAQQPAAFYEYTDHLRRRNREQQQDVLDQPTVFGYPAYYETDYYKVWINATTLSMRGYFGDTLVNGTFRAGGRAITFNSLEFVKRLPAPSDAVKLVDDICATLMAVDLTRQQKNFLIDQVLIPGLPRYEWTYEWQGHTSDPNNAAKRMSLKMKLDNLFRFLFRMAEYQMC
jgi:uncharacterized protein (DUF1800 family)